MRSIVAGLGIVAVLAAGRAHAQVFEPGYLVTTTGDTLRGELENRFWQAPPEAVAFRPAAGTPARTYLRRQLRAFRLASGRYFRAEVLPLDRAAQTQVENLTIGLLSQQRPDSLLAEVLIDGAVPLLRAVPGGVTHYFVRRAGQPFLELTERRYLADSGTGPRVIDANNYRSQLTVYFGDCPAAVRAAGTAPFTARGLAGVVQAYSQQCTPGQQPGPDLLAGTRPVQSFAFNGGLLAGAGFNYLRLVRSSDLGEEAPLLDNLNVDGRLHPHLGAYFDVLLPGRQWLAHSELSFSTFGRAGEFPLADGTGAYAWRGTKLDARLGARYMLRQQPTRAWFVGAGLNLNFTTSDVSGEQYGAGDTRLTARNVRVPTKARFLAAMEFAPGPYLEVGLRQGRFTASLDAGLTGGVDYVDPLTVYTAFRGTGGGEVSDYIGYHYSGLLLGYRAVLAYRLGHSATAQ